MLLTHFVKTAARAAALACLCSAAVAADSRYSVKEEPAAGPGSPRVVVLRDDAAGLEAAVAPDQGGELTSLRARYRGTWVELIYRARDYGSAGGFRGKAAFLWPAVGGQYEPGHTPASSCEDGTYRLGGRSYPMPCHGFAQKMAWATVARSADERAARVTLELYANDATRSTYPFGFRLRAEYTLSEGALRIAYRVLAAPENASPMPFAIGNHLSLKLPFLTGTAPEEMTFETPNSFELLRDAHGLITDNRRNRSFARPTRLGDFDSSVALPLAGYQGAPYALLRDPQGLALRIAQSTAATLPEPLVRFNLYGGPKQGYLCPEPWFGRQNSLNLDHGHVTLAAGAEWSWTVELRPEFAAPPAARP